MPFARGFCLWKAAFLCWLFLSVVRADPVPDFAINAAVSGSATVSSLALETKTLFQNIAGVVFELQAGYERLATAKAAMTEIGTQISQAGMELSQAISTMALNRSGPIASFFNPINTAIGKLQRLVTTELTGQMTILSGVIDSFVTTSLQDSFRIMSQSLTTLSNAVTNLRAAVTSAREASGSSVTVSPLDVRRFVTARIVSDMTNGVRLVRSSVPILVYTVRTTLGSFQTADQYLVGIVEEAQLREQEVVEQGNTNQADVNSLVGTLKGRLTSELNGPYLALRRTYRDTIQDEVETNAAFQTVVDALLDDAKALFDDLTVSGEVETSFSTYLGLLLALDDDLGSFYGTGMCSVIQNLLQALIENGPHAPFCFSKFGQKVLNLFVLHVTDTEDCYRLQMNRLEKLLPAVFNIVQLMQHDIDDILDNVERCTDFSNLDNCVPFLETEYKTLLAFTFTKRQYLYQLVAKETHANHLRLEACYSNSKHLLLLSSEEIKKDIAICKVSGPVSTV